MNLVRGRVGYKPRINNKNDAKCMNTYLLIAPESELVMTKLGPVKNYLPVEALLLDYLTVETEGLTRWKYPRLQDFRTFQQKQGLTYSVLDEVKVREITCGVSSTEEIQKFHKWTTEKHLENQNSFDSGVISMDVEDIKVSYYDVKRMAGKIVISRASQSFQTLLDNSLVSGLLEDSWKQTPGKIMFSDGLTWCANITLPYKRNHHGDYVVERIRVQPRPLDVL